MLSKSNIHWLVPLTIASSLLGGVALAVAHHLFYNSLAGTVVDADKYSLAGYNISQQQLNIAVGTTLAFLSRSCLVIALSSAYTQVFWYTVKRRGVQTRLSTLDVLHTVLSNVWHLVRPEIWWTRPFLLFIALVTWLIPISSVITPATLSVVLTSISPAPTSLVHVPRADFESLKFFAPGQGNLFSGISIPETLIYNGPAYMVERVALSVASGGSILPITPPFHNASWTTTFNGPALQCSMLNSTFERAVRVNMVNAYRLGSGCQQPYNYLSWTGTPGLSTPGIGASYKNPYATHAVPFGDNSSSFAMNTGTVGPLLYDTIGPTADGNVNGTGNATQVATLYFAAVPNFRYREMGSCNMTRNATDDEIIDQFRTTFTNSTMLQCQLLNTTYQTAFTYVNGEQSINISRPNPEQDKPVDTLAGFYMGTSNSTCSSFNSDYTECSISRSTLQRLSFQAIMDAFGRVFVGSVLDGQNSKYGGTYVSTTRLLSTILLDTKELSFLRQPSNWAQVITSNESKGMESLYDWSPETSQKPLKDTIEQLFQNITISMLGSEHFQPNVSSPFAPGPVNVTQDVYRNVYVYAETKLWIAYGIAIGFAVLGVGIGVAAMCVNEASFSNEFSTIFRVSRFARVSGGCEVKKEDGGGMDPLPEYLVEARVDFGAGDGKMVGVEEWSSRY